MITKMQRGIIIFRPVLTVMLIEGKFIQNVENSVILNQVNQINPNSIIYN